MLGHGEEQLDELVRAARGAQPAMATEAGAAQLDDLVAERLVLGCLGEEARATLGGVTAPSDLERVAPLLNRLARDIGGTRTRNSAA